MLTTKPEQRTQFLRYDVINLNIEGESNMASKLHWELPRFLSQSQRMHRLRENCLTLFSAL